MVGGWCAGQSVPLPRQAWFGALPLVSPDGAGVWSQQGLQDDAALAVAAFRVYAPPRPGCRFSRSLGPLARVLALVAYANSIEPGSVWGRSRERTPRAGRANAACRGSGGGARIAPTAFATAIRGDCTEALRRLHVLGASLLGSRHSVPQSYRTRHTGTRKSHATRSAKLTADKWVLSETEPGCREAEGETKRA